LGRGDPCTQSQTNRRGMIAAPFLSRTIWRIFDSAITGHSALSLGQIAVHAEVIWGTIRMARPLLGSGG